MNRYLLFTVFIFTAPLFFFNGCKCNVEPGKGAVAAGPFSPMAASGPTSWEIESKSYTIANTYYIALPDGLQYTIEYEVPDDFVLDGITKEKATEAAFLLMEHAYKNELYKRTKVWKAGEGNEVVSLIGVAHEEKRHTHQRTPGIPDASRNCCSNREVRVSDAVADKI